MQQITSTSTSEATTKPVGSMVQGNGQAYVQLGGGPRSSPRKTACAVWRPGGINVHDVLVRQGIEPHLGPLRSSVFSIIPLRSALPATRTCSPYRFRTSHMQAGLRRSCRSSIHTHSSYRSIPWRKRHGSIQSKHAQRQTPGGCNGPRSRCRHCPWRPRVCNNESDRKHCTAASLRQSREALQGGGGA